MHETVSLNRTLGLPLLLLYGLGTILGAGIYVLTGVVVAETGESAPLAFFLAALVSAPTAYSYSVLARKYPKAAGEAVYVERAFTRRRLTQFVGYSVVGVGIVSAATISRGFVGYLDVFISPPVWLTIILLIATLTGLAIFGVLESVAVAAIISILEIGGLFMVVFGGLGETELRPLQIWPEASIAAWTGVLSATFLAFYAFIGFEDIVNMAEETKNPERNLPLAIVWSLGLSTFIYFCVAYISVASVPVDLLANHPAPMALVVEQHGVFDANIVAAISMLAVVNGALVQIIMAARVVYGLNQMQNEGSLLSRINPATQTPVLATLIVGLAVAILALAFKLRALASLTSMLTLTIFLFVNLALCKLQGKPTRPVHSIAWLAACMNILLLLIAVPSF